MIVKLSQCAQFGDEFVVGEEFWEQLEEIISVLQSPFNATVDMQRTGFGLADFYISWLRIAMNVRRIENNAPKFDLAEKLREKMEIRAPSLLETPLMLCAVYLDPRIMFKLNVDQKSSAAMALVNVFERVTTTGSDEGQGANDTLDEIQQEYHARNNWEQTNTDRLFQEMSEYENVKPYDIRASVMDFWDENSEKYKLLRSLAEVFHAVPSNQGIVEQGFSSFSYIRSKYRMCLSPENLSNVLMVRLNKDLFYLERQKQVQKIINGKMKKNSVNLDL